jgi:hypothetical protein
MSLSTNLNPLKFSKRFIVAAHLQRSAASQPSYRITNRVNHNYHSWEVEAMIHFPETVTCSSNQSFNTLSNTIPIYLGVFHLAILNSSRYRYLKYYRTEPITRKITLCKFKMRSKRKKRRKSEKRRKECEEIRKSSRSRLNITRLAKEVPVHH